MSSGSRRLEDLRREATAAARGLQGGEHALIGALEAFQAESERFAETYHAMVRSLALALEARDGYTGEHSDDVHALTVAVARRLGLCARETGARGLRSIIEEVLLEVQFELPSRRDVKKCVVTKETIERGVKPTLVTEAPDEGEQQAAKSA